MISVEVFMDIFSLRKQGFSMRSIARKLGIHRKTVKTHLENGMLPTYNKIRHKASILDPYCQLIQDFLKRR